MKKIVCIINGKGGAGKDTLIQALEGQESVVNVSSIDPIKGLTELLLTAVTEDSEDKPAKTLPYRKLLADIKSAMDTYYKSTKGIGFTTEYVVNQLRLFAWSDGTVMFVHIREPENIIEFFENAKKALCELKEPNVKFTTLLIRSCRTKEHYGNSADDNVENYPYDYIYESEGDEKTDAEIFRAFFSTLRKELENE